MALAFLFGLQPKCSLRSQPTPSPSLRGRGYSDRGCNRDRGTTLRRHVVMTGTHHIGKESHDWERQALLGLNLDSEIAYGVSTYDLVERLRSFIAEFGERMAAKALGISAVQLSALVASSPSPRSESLTQKVASRLPAAQRLCAKLNHNRHAELRRLREMRDRYGLRETARRLGVDPSNLRRKFAEKSWASDRHRRSKGNAALGILLSGLSNNYYRWSIHLESVSAPKEPNDSILLNLRFEKGIICSNSTLLLAVYSSK
jgi:hypothetical protein